MPPFTHIRRHSASTIASISSTFTSFYMPQRASTRAVSTTKSLSAATSRASRAISHAPMGVVKRQLRVNSAKTFSYSGLFVTSFLIASFLPFQLAPTGNKVKSGGRRSDKRSRAQREKANQDPDRHDMDSKSMASDPSGKSKQHRSSTTESTPQIHANHRSGSSLRSSTHGSSYRPRRTGNSTLGGVGRRGSRQHGAAGRVSARKQKDARMAMRRQGWR